MLPGRAPPESAEAVDLTVTRRRRFRGLGAGEPFGTEGGVAIFVLLVIVVGGMGLGVALYATGGALWFSRGKDESPPPRGKTDPIPENTTQVRPPREGEDQRR